LKFLDEIENFRLRIIKSDEYFRRFGDVFEESRQFQDEPSIEYEQEILEIERIPQKSQPKESKSRHKPICRFCGKLQESEYRLKQHELQSHTPLCQIPQEEVLICDLCGRNFKTKQSIRNHFIRSHTPKDEVFPCSVCGKVRRRGVARFHLTVVLFSRFSLTKRLCTLTNAFTSRPKSSASIAPKPSQGKSFCHRTSPSFI
jgi:hypothetical protein